MTVYTRFQFSYNTAEEENNYFTGVNKFQFSRKSGNSPFMKPGLYRVMDGKLYSVQKGLPPNLQSPKKEFSFE